MLARLDRAAETIAGSRVGRGLFIAFLTTISLATLAVIAPLFFFMRFSIPASSMNPTLYVGDLLLASHIAYDSDVQRGDIALFWVGHGEERVIYIKRVIGLPGDRVEVRKGQVILNGTPVARRKIAAQPVDAGDGWMPVAAFEETLPGGFTVTVVEANDEGPFDNFGEMTVPADHYFMLGDNRDNSYDSRALDRIGYIARDALVGKAKWIYFSAGRDGVRFGRIGRRID